MKLILTQYVDAEPVAVNHHLERAVCHALEAAADRIAAPCHDVATEQMTDGVRVHGGLQILDGSEVHVSGEERLTVLRFVVPWTSADRDGAKFLAANTLAHAIASEVAAVA